MDHFRHNPHQVGHFVTTRKNVGGRDGKVIGREEHHVNVKHHDGSVHKYHIKDIQTNHSIDRP